VESWRGNVETSVAAGTAVEEVGTTTVVSVTPVVVIDSPGSVAMRDGSSSRSWRHAATLPPTRPISTTNAAAFVNRR
jgi:hypothetical protein